MENRPEKVVCDGYPDHTAITFVATTPPVSLGPIALGRASCSVAAPSTFSLEFSKFEYDGVARPVWMAALGLSISCYIHSNSKGSSKARF